MAKSIVVSSENFFSLDLVVWMFAMNFNTLD